jgi:uncharacterized RmlC-like cupin family protein
MAKKYGHLIKKFEVTQTPEGLYNTPRFWKQGPDMEGFNAHLSYGFFEEPTVCHPIDDSKALVHPYDECLVFVGNEPDNIFHLGGKISIELGEEREVHTFTEPSVVCVPKGTPHGPAKILEVDTPIIHYHFGLDPIYKAEIVTHKAQSPGSGDCYKHLVKKMITSQLDPSGQGSSGALVQGKPPVLGADGVMRPALAGVGPGNGDAIIWLYGSDLEGFNVNFTWGFYSTLGKWHRSGEIHTHPEAEILVFVGLNPDKMDYLGCEVEMGFGKESERHVLNDPGLMIAPEGFPHLPMITRWCDKPYGFFVLCLSGDHASPWVEVEEDD